jgi:cytochrome c peroxidase
VRKFDDLPPRFADTVEVQGPFGQHTGEASVLSEDDVGDLVAFLTTLSDGYVPAN